jgi:hypothetical protein
VNQDRITDNVWLTRANNRGLFNIKSESIYVNSKSPLDTEWAFGTTSNISILTFNNWEDTLNSNPLSALNQDMVLHLVTDDIYIDIKFTSWDSGNVGGGFSYTRSTNQALSITQNKKTPAIKVFPNPSNDFITVNGLESKKNFSMFNISGIKLIEGTLSNNKSIDIEHLTDGLYFLFLENYKPLKFLKH